jgi:hypothetical protein
MLLRRDRKMHIDRTVTQYHTKHRDLAPTRVSRVGNRGLYIGEGIQTVLVCVVCPGKIVVHQITMTYLLEKSNVSLTKQSPDITLLSRLMQTALQKLDSLIISRDYKQATNLIVLL